MTKKRIANLEEHLERLIEGGFARLFRGSLQPREVAIQLARAIEDNTLSGIDGREVAPSQYQITFNPGDYAALLAQTPDLSGQLAERVVDYCMEIGLHLLSTPEVILAADAGVAPRSLIITARHVVTRHETTQIMQPVQAPPPVLPPDAQLIIDGDRTIPLQTEVVNIGRHPENDLVLNDVRVSRHHVQLRLRHGKYVIYDRQSRSGTFVNGHRISEQILMPGDVIRIGGISLLYMEEERDTNLDDTQLDMLSPDRPEGK
jgi:hypothetical protein